MLLIFMEVISMDVEKLFEIIKEEINKYVDMVHQFGADHPMTKNYCSQIHGMQKAFEIISGTSYTNYLISKLS